ncbi:bifunctional glutamate N-acetyltransferase/amino-acid acetyltransferase ArgJ [Magnetococcus sp. PR-3]|uniref:bifunctional glutamate N-acetyltransferase/amino-acid acetyltransferase ArgJ n=1 Tax=Magnetococcus sp. PR-3 TaxID=3120355 RepID=UPI002FCE0417
MAVGTPPTPELPPIAGFRASATACGIKKDEILDLTLVEMQPGTHVAGVFTKNRIVSPTVTLCRDRLQEGEARALLVNSGNANVSNGPKGMLDALSNGKTVADTLDLQDNRIFISSTGVIGEALPAHKINAAIPTLVENLQPGNWWEAAKGIMTTDTFPKAGVRHCMIDGKPVTLVGMAKGSGMIHPDMATMLAYLFTDAAIESELLQKLLNQAVNVSFNSITVDGDSSTNDTLMLFASGAAGHTPIDTEEDERLAPFVSMLNDLAIELAQWIVRDGEGASKFVTVTVEGAVDESAARQVAMGVAASSLVKTAFAGSDPNWGRISMAVGAAGVAVEEDLIDIFLGDVQIVQRGQRHSDYTEEQGQTVMNEEEISVTIQLNQGHGHATIWTCDLTHGYISINADYRS